MNSSSNRILIPKAAGGPRLRYDARPWIIMMASSVHHADNAERNDALKWSIDCVQTARLWLQERIEILIRKGVFGLTSNIIGRKTWLVESVRENVA
jgi:hypothetical protein